MWSRVLIPRWSKTPGLNSTLNCDPESWFNFKLSPCIGITIQRGILTKGHNSTWNFDPGLQFNVKFWPVYISSTRGIATQEGVKIQQRDQNSTAKEGHNSTKNPLNIDPGSVFNWGVKIVSYTGSSKCSTKPLSIPLTKLLTHLQKYCETAYSRSGINQMWILKNSKELLEHLKSPTFNHVTSIKSFDFSTLYTTLPHQKLKDRLTSIIRNAFTFKNGNRRYKYLVLGHEETYFVKEHSDSKNKYSEDDIIKMLEFLGDNIFVVFAGKVFQQTVGIPMGTNCAPLLADIFLYSYEADFIQSLLSTGKKHLASRFNLTYRYIDYVLSINNPEFENYLDQIYPAELEIKDTTESTTSASYLDLLLSIGRDGQLHTSIYDKRDDFNFHITNFPFLSSIIPSSPAYGVFISQLIRYARACFSYECFILRARRLSSKLLKQGYLVERLKSSFSKFYGR